MGCVLVTFKQKSDFSFFTRKTEPAVGQLLTGSRSTLSSQPLPSVYLGALQANVETTLPHAAA